MRVEIAQDEGRRGMAMRLDFDFQGNAGYLIARKQIDLALPDDYAFTFYIRGEAPREQSRDQADRRLGPERLVVVAAPFRVLLATGAS